EAAAPRPALAFALAAALALGAGPARAGGAPPDSLPRLHPGALEVGVAGALTSVAGGAFGDLAFTAGRVLRAPRGLLEVALEPAYAHVAGLDELDTEGSLVWLHPLGGAPGALGYAGLGGGPRETWVGSFREGRVGVGFDVGLRVLVTPGAGARVAYRFRRVLNDPVADYDEHRVLVGLSIYLRNRAR
ncbi:MAG TPA: hypothetical protein VGU27_07060, partial [Candidatus Eisenbacteria bacterium]|nr:hypothetical protein [Candidatus Eisenbacteria bacterium]